MYFNIEQDKNLTNMKRSVTSLANYYVQAKDYMPYLYLRDLVVNSINYLKLPVLSTV